MTSDWKVKKIATNKELSALGRNIARHRRMQEISQEELSFRCDLHRTYLSDVERGARNLSFNSILVIARGLGLTVSELTRDVEIDAAVERPSE